MILPLYYRIGGIHFQFLLSMAHFQVKTKKGKSFYLDDNSEIHRGGEGRILLIPTDQTKVAKIYHQGINGLTERRFEQLQKLDGELFLKPHDLLFVQKEIVGFTMEYAGKEFFPLSAMFNKSFCQRNGVSLQFKKKVANKIIEAVKQAHFNGFIIGDLNQFNVLVNLNSELKLIDVDSYETPGYKHSGCLLEDIRDYYYHGHVSMNSDYFALSVLLFYLLTYTHPFKGIHKKYKSLAERMIHKLPVFVNDPLLTTPKCYHPIAEPLVETKFARTYLNGERFLITVDDVPIIQPVPKPVLVKKYEEKDVNISSLIDNTAISDVYFNQNLGCVKTKNEFVIFSCTNYKTIERKFNLPLSEFEAVYLGGKNILAKKGNRLFQIIDSKSFVEIKNFAFKDSVIAQFDNILVVLCQGQLYKLFLDEVLNGSIRVKRTEVFSEAFKHHNGFIQNAGGVLRIFYHAKNDLASVKTHVQIKQVEQRGNVGVIQFVENNKLINKYFKISGLKVDLADEEVEFINGFTYMPAGDGGFVFEPSDNKLLVKRVQDFKTISEIKCSKLSNQSNLFYTKSGIVAWEDNDLYLLNKKDSPDNS